MAHGLVKKFKHRREERRQDRRDSKDREASKRAQADAYMQDAMTSARNLQNAVPNAAQQIRDANSVYGQGSQEARIDPSSYAAQQQALGMQGDIARQGFTAEDNASIQAANRAANLNEQAQRQAVEQSAAMRGMRGGGLQMMGALAAQQGGANRAADQASQIGQARIQARQAGVGNLGNMAAQQGQMAQSRGAAADAFAQNGLQTRQGLQQQQFSNQLAASQNMQGQATTAAGYNQNAADKERERRQSVLNNIMGAAGGAIGAAT